MMLLLVIGFDELSIIYYCLSTGIKHKGQTSLFFVYIEHFLKGCISQFIIILKNKINK